MKINGVLFSLLALNSSQILSADAVDWKSFNNKQTDCTLRVLDWKRDTIGDSQVTITINESSPATKLMLDSDDHDKTTAQYDGIKLWLW